MRTGSLFWGSILILIGGLLLLDNLGLLPVDLWGIFWPSLIILIGLWTLWGVFFRRRPETEHANIPLDGAGRAHVRIHHGAGRLRVHAGAGAGDLAEGDFGGGLDVDTRRDGDTLSVRMRVPQQVWFPFSWGPGSSLDWDFGLSRDLPLNLEFETGANDSRIDLSELQVTDLRLSSGASSTELTFPARAGLTRAKISTGAASVRVRLPEGVAARIRAGGGLASITVDTARFPHSGAYYQSPDYDAAENKVDLDVETGVGSVDIR